MSETPNWAPQNQKREIEKNDGRKKWSFSSFIIIIFIRQLHSKRSKAITKAYDLPNHQDRTTTFFSSCYKKIGLYRQWRILRHPRSRNHSQSRQPTPWHRARRLWIEPGLVTDGFPCRATSAKKRWIPLFLFVRANACFARVRKSSRVGITQHSKSRPGFRFVLSSTNRHSLFISKDI